MEALAEVSKVVTGAEEYSFEKLLEIYQLALGRDKKTNFVRGDIALEITKRSEEAKEKNPEKDLIKEFLSLTGENEKSFVVRRWVSRSYPPGPMRELLVHWTHYRTAAKTENPIYWLQKAHDESWSVATLIEEISLAKAEKKVEVGYICDCGCGAKIEKDSIIGLSGVSKHKLLFSSKKCVINYLQSETLVDNIGIRDIPEEDIQKEFNMDNYSGGTSNLNWGDLEIKHEEGPFSKI